MMDEMMKEASEAYKDHQHYAIIKIMVVCPKASIERTLQSILRVLGAEKLLDCDPLPGRRHWQRVRSSAVKRRARGPAIASSPMFVPRAVRQQRAPDAPRPGPSPPLPSRPQSKALTQHPLASGTPSLPGSQPICPPSSPRKSPSSPCPGGTQPSCLVEAHGRKEEVPCLGGPKLVDIPRSETPPVTAESVSENREPADDEVKSRSSDQRAADPGEPTCVVCGRYGEYICDETDDDVCSVECKAVVLGRLLHSGLSEKKVIEVHNEGHSGPRKSKAVVYFRDSLPSMRDEAEIIVRDGEKSLPEWEPDSAIGNLTQQQVDTLRNETGISVQGDDVPKPILDFSNCKFLPKLRSNLETAGFEAPTPVQMQVIPAALKVRDVLVSAGTGSGKTAGYLLSIVSRICLIRYHYQQEARNPLAIVLTPTRELCAQVEEQAKALAKSLPFKTALVVGGDAMPQQLYRISQGVELIVGTPGRLIDLVAKHDIELGDVCLLVLDEVDCMLGQGFRDEVLQIRTALTRPQVLLFSATISQEIEKISASILKNPVRISVGSSNLPTEAVKQTVIWVESKQKKKKLFEILQSPHHFHPPVVVFVNSRVGAELLADSIQLVTGLQAAAVHGEKPMQERRQVLKAFLMGSLNVVVATGVLGRGLDLLRVTQVIVFDMPYSAHEYIHQIGRASRLGVPGSAMLFINDDSKVLFKELVELFRRSGAVIPKELSNSPFATSSYALAYNPRKRKAYQKGKRG